MKRIVRLIGLAAAAGAGGAVAGVGIGAPSTVALMFGGLLAFLVGFAASEMSAAEEPPLPTWSSGGTAEEADEVAAGAGVMPGWRPQQDFSKVPGATAELVPWTGMLMMDRMPEGASVTTYATTSTSHLNTWD